MNVEQIYTGCLAEATYFIQSDSECAIVDPLRETDVYLEKISSSKTSLKYIFITHFHADFVSGHVDLAKETGASIVFGPKAEASFDFYQAHDGEIFNVGGIQIKALHTPGHTLESTCYLLLDEQEKEYCIFTGDTLFIGDVGRPDLAVKSDLSQADLAKLLHQSLKEKIKPLGDHVIIYPAHGAGSACGKNMSKERFDTLGNQRKLNYALNDKLTVDDFVSEVTCGLNQPPNYFPVNVAMNKGINKTFNDIIKSGIKPLNAKEFKSLCEKATVIDCRKPQEFALSHIPNSLFVGIDGGFAPWAASVMKKLDGEVLLLVEEGREHEAVTRLARVGIDNTIGFLNGGIIAWENAGYKTEMVHSIDAMQFESEINKESNIIDVRNNGEYANGHLMNSVFRPLDQIHQNLNEYQSETNYYIHCQGGYRSMIACSILKANGVHNVTDIKGGFGAIAKSTSLQITNEEIAI